MYRIALKMLFGDTTKYLTLVIGLTFSVLLIVQQSSIFCGLMMRSASLVFDINAPIWVMDKQVDTIDGGIPLSDAELYRVRNVPGVEWAVPLSISGMEARSADGTVGRVQLIGVDDESLTGIPQTVLEGRIEDIYQPDGVVLGDVMRYLYGAPDVGERFEINDHEVKPVAIVSGRRSIFSSPLIYTTYNKAKQLSPPVSKYLRFVLASPSDGYTT